MKFHLEITKAKEITTVLYILFDHPSYMGMAAILVMSPGLFIYMYLSAKKKRKENGTQILENDNFDGV